MVIHENAEFLSQYSVTMIHGIFLRFKRCINCISFVLLVCCGQ